jgi:hypothetical protein
MAEHIYIDESGSLADPHCPIVTLAAVKTISPKTLRWIVKRAMRRVKRKKSKRGGPSELKFHNATENARVMVLEALAQEKVQVYALGVFKGAQIIPHTPENYGILLCVLLRMCGAEHEHVDELSVDMPFNVPQQRARLTAVVRASLNLDVKPCYVDSVKNPYVQLADFVAGAVHAKQTGRNPVFYQFIRPQIISDQLVTWRTLRREWMESSR